MTLRASELRVHIRKCLSNRSLNKGISDTSFLLSLLSIHCNRDMEPIKVHTVYSQVVPTFKLTSEFD